MRNSGIAVCLMILLAVFAISCQSNKTEKVSDQEATASVPEQPQETSHADHVSTERIPPYYDNPDAVALEATLDPATVAPEAQAAYTVAKDNPKLLAQLPCFCYCDRFGHGSLQSCFVSDHAMSCDICIKEAIEADQLQNQGMAPAEIRSAIIAKYHPRT